MRRGVGRRARAAGSTSPSGDAPPARSIGSCVLERSRGARARSGCSSVYEHVMRGIGAAGAPIGMKVAHPRRRHVLLHGAGNARARLSRRVGSRAGLPGDRAVRDRLRARRAFRASTGTRARHSRSSATRALVPLLKDAIARGRATDRAARLHAPGLSGRLRVSGRAGSGAARSRDGLRVSAADALDAASPSSCRRTTRCRSAAWPRSAPPD